MKMKKVGMFVTILMTALLGLASSAAAVTGVILDKVDIGDTTSEVGHSLVSWGPIEPTTHGGNWGVFGGSGEDCRVIWNNDDVDEGTAMVALDRCTRPGAATSIIIKHLDGFADDSFNVFVKDEHGEWIQIGSYSASPGGPETWVTSLFALPNGRALQLDRERAVEVMVKATGPKWGGFGTYGQVAFDWIELVGNGKK